MDNVSIALEYLMTTYAEDTHLAEQAQSYLNNLWNIMSPEERDEYLTAAAAYTETFGNLL